MTEYSISIVDTGATITFFSASQQEILLSALETLSARILVPSGVLEEMRNKARDSSRFQRPVAIMEGVLRSGRMVEIGSDSPAGTRLHQNLSALLGGPYEARSFRQKDLGERVVIAHAMTYQAEGETVVALIDDRPGQELAAARGVTIVDTFDILRTAARAGLLPTWGDMRDVYLKIQPFDSGLPGVSAPKVQQELRGFYNQLARQESV